MSKRKHPTRASLDPAAYPRPTKWHRGFVSKAQVAKFKRTPKLAKYVNGMYASTPGGSTRAARVASLPARVHRKGKR